MRRCCPALWVLWLAAAIVGCAEQRFIEKQYDGFRVVVDCRHKGPIAYELTLQADTEADHQRSRGPFALDTSIPDDCQMTSGVSFDMKPEEVKALGRFQRGHLADANSLDSRASSITQSYFRTNMLPQAGEFGRGAWRGTELISECYREITPLRIWGGVIWGDDEANDVFEDTHDVTTPDRWWKVIYRGDTDTYIAWIFENNQDETRAVMDDRIVTLEVLKPQLEFVPDFGPAEDATASTKTWLVEGRNPLRCEGIEAPLS